MCETVIEPSADGQPLVALITGAARRIGAGIARYLHQHGYRVVIHYHHSKQEAEQLCAELNQQRSNSCLLLQADLQDSSQWQRLADDVKRWQGRLDLLVNNASSYFPTPIGKAGLEDWQTLFASNAQAPYFLTQALAPLLQATQGSVVNIVDALVDQSPLEFSLYSMAKAALQSQTLSLAKELAPALRVNGIGPGSILWPEYDGELSEEEQAKTLAEIPLQRQGRPEDIAHAVYFLAQANYVTGQILAVDGGRSL